MTPRAQDSLPASSGKGLRPEGSLPGVLGFVQHSWDKGNGWSSRHRLLTGLGARGWPVVFSSGPLSTGCSSRLASI